MSETTGNASTTPSPPPERDFDPSRVAKLSDIQSVMDLLASPIWIFDFTTWRPRWGNQAALTLWGSTSNEEFTGRDFSLQMSDTSRKRIEQTVECLERGYYCSDQWTFYPNGQATTMRITTGSIRLEEDRICSSPSSEESPRMCFLCSGERVTHHDIENDVLRGVEMLRHLPIAVCQFDLAGKVIFENPQAVLLEEQLPESTTSDNNSTDHKDDTDSEGAKKRKRAHAGLLSRFVDKTVGETVLKRVKEEFPVESVPSLELEAMLHTTKGPTWSAIQLRKIKDPVTGDFVLLFSATDKSDAVKARKERQEREMYAEFLAIMAHEIRTPLHQVMGYIDLLDQTQLDQEQKSFVKVLRSSSQGLMLVINDLLDVSKLESGKMKLECIPYEPLAVVKGSLEAVQAACEEKSLYLKLDWDTAIPFKLKSDPNRLRQILLNLLSNAIKFTKLGGILVTVTYLSSDQSKTTTPFLKYSVTDTGIGISKEQMNVIFQKYQQADKSIARNYGGTGLGLSICHQLVKLMGGTIGVESSIGEGATFSFILPALEPTEKDLAGDAEDDETDIQPVKSSPPIAICNNSITTSNACSNGSPAIDKEKTESGLSVLVVEDNKVNQKLVMSMLKRLGHRVALAENGKEAIDMVEKGGATEYDICLMDIQMPICDGFEATKRLRSMGYIKLPIYGLTASIGRSDYQELGFSDWLLKPVRLKELKKKLCDLQARLQENI